MFVQWAELERNSITEAREMKGYYNISIHILYFMFLRSKINNILLTDTARVRSALSSF